MIRERMPDAPVDSADMIFKPEVAQHFADCGITFLDEPTDVIPMVMVYLGHDPNSLDPARSRGSRSVLKSVRPYIRYFSSAKMLIDLPNEEVCIAMSWSGDYAQAMYRAQEVGKPVRARLHDATAKERWRGSTCGSFRRMRRIRGNAHLFLNYLLRPEVIAAISNETRYAAPNPSGDAAAATGGAQRSRGVSAGGGPAEPAARESSTARKRSARAPVCGRA